MTVRVISRSTIQPKHNDRRRNTIELTPNDLQQLFSLYIQRGFVFNRPTTRSSDIIGHLKTSLSLALDVFYPLAGRMRVTEYLGTASYHLDCNGDGALFIHGATDHVGVSNISEDALEKLFPMGGLRNYEAAIDDLALLAVQVTELVDGGFFIAVAMNHTIADGTSFWKFVNTWSEISRGSAVSSPQPVFRRQCLNWGVTFPVHLPMSLVQICDMVLFRHPTVLESTVIHFSAEKIAEIKAEANSGVGSEDAVSSLQALMAHLWVCETRARRVSAGEEVSYAVVMDLRLRLEPPLPLEYFGNAVRTAEANCTAGEILELGTGWAARRIKRGIIEAQSPAEVRKFMEDWEAAVEQILARVAMPLTSSVPLLTIGSPRFDVYGNDFGWGKPIGSRKSPELGFPGMIMASPGMEKGSVDFEVCLSAKTLCGLANDPEFLGVFIS